MSAIMKSNRTCKDSELLYLEKSVILTEVDFENCTWQYNLQWVGRIIILFIRNTDLNHKIVYR